MPEEQSVLSSLLKQLNDVSWHSSSEEFTLSEEERRTVSSLNSYVDQYCPKFLFLENWSVVGTYYSVFIRTLPLDTPFSFYTEKMNALLSYYCMHSYKKPSKNSTKEYLNFKILNLGFREFLEVQKQIANIKNREKMDIEVLLKFCNELQNFFYLYQKFLEHKEHQYQSDIEEIEVLIFHTLSALEEALNSLPFYDQVVLLVECGRVILEYLDFLVLSFPEEYFTQCCVQYLRLYALRLLRCLSKMNTEDLSNKIEKEDFFGSVVRLFRGMLSFSSLEELEKDLRYVLPLYFKLLTDRSLGLSSHEGALRLYHLIFLFFGKKDKKENRLDFRKDFSKVEYRALLLSLIEKEPLVLRRLLLSCALNTYASNEKNFDAKLISFNVIGELTEWNLDNNLYFIQEKQRPLFFRKKSIPSNKILEMLRKNFLSDLNKKSLFNLAECFNSFLNEKKARFKNLRDGFFDKTEFDYYIFLFFFRESFFRETQQKDIITVKKILDYFKGENLFFLSNLFEYFLKILTQCMEIDVFSYNFIVPDSFSFDFHPIHSEIINNKIKFFGNPVFLETEISPKNEGLLRDLRFLCYQVFLSSSLLSEKERNNFLLSSRFILKENNFLEFRKEEKERILETINIRVKSIYDKNIKTTRFREKSIKDLLSDESETVSHLERMLQYEIGALGAVIEMWKLVLKLPGHCTTGLEIISKFSTYRSKEVSFIPDLAKWQVKLKRKKEILENYRKVYQNCILKLKEDLSKVVDKSNRLKMVLETLSIPKATLLTYYDYFIEHQEGRITSKTLVEKILKKSRTNILGITVYDFLKSTTPSKKIRLNFFAVLGGKEKNKRDPSMFSKYTDICSDSETKSEDNSSGFYYKT